MAFYVYANPISGVVRVHRDTCSVATRTRGPQNPSVRQDADTIEEAVILARRLKLAQGGGRIEGCGLCGTQDLM